MIDGDYQCVFCKNKYELDVLQKYLIENCDFLWADGTKYYCPFWLNDEEGLLLNLGENKRLTVSTVKMHDWQLEFDDFLEEMGMIDNKKVKKFADDLFKIML